MRSVDNGEPWRKCHLLLCRKREPRFCRRHCHSCQCHGPVRNVFPGVTCSSRHTSRRKRIASLSRIRYSNTRMQSLSRDDNNGVVRSTMLIICAYEYGTDILIEPESFIVFSAK